MASELDKKDVCFVGKKPQIAGDIQNFDHYSGYSGGGPHSFGIYPVDNGSGCHTTATHGVLYGNPEWRA